MKILVLGGNGFLGSHVVDALVGEGHSVSVFDRFPTGQSAHLASLGNRIRIISGEFENVKDVDLALQGQEVVYHFICVTNPFSSWNEPIVELQANILPTLRFLDRCREAGVRKVVFPSSGGTIYGRQVRMVSEEDKPSPYTPYGIAKLAVERFLEYYHERDGLAYDVYRISNAYGPRQSTTSRQGVIPIWMNDILNRKPLMVYGDHSIKRDYVYVTDIARLLMYSLRDLDRSGVFNLGTGTPTSILELLELMKQHIDVPFQVKVHPPRPSDNICSVLDSARLLAHFEGFRFKTLSEGLPLTWRYVKQLHQQIQPPSDA